MNEQTAVNNYYQKVLDNLTPTSVNAKAQEEFDMIEVSEWLQNVAIVSQDTKTGVYQVSVELEDKEMAAKIANEYYVILDDYLKNTTLHYLI